MTLQRAISFLVCCTIIFTAGCQEGQKPEVTLGAKLDEANEELVYATDVKMLVNGKEIGESTPVLQLGQPSQLLVHFSLPDQFESIPDTSLKAVRTRPDGVEVVQTSTRGKPQRLKDGSYEVAFDIQPFSKTMEMEVRIQSGFKRVPYVVTNFDIRVEQP